MCVLLCGWDGKEESCLCAHTLDYPSESHCQASASSRWFCITGIHLIKIAFLWKAPAARLLSTSHPWQGPSSLPPMMQHKVNHFKCKPCIYGVHGSLRSRVNKLCFQNPKSDLCSFFWEVKERHWSISIQSSLKCSCDNTTLFTERRRRPPCLDDLQVKAKALTSHCKHLLRLFEGQITMVNTRFKLWSLDMYVFTAQSELGNGGKRLKTQRRRAHATLAGEHGFKSSAPT